MQPQSAWKKGGRKYEGRNTRRKEGLEIVQKALGGEEGETPLSRTTTTKENSAATGHIFRSTFAVLRLKSILLLSAYHVRATMREETAKERKLTSHVVEEIATKNRYLTICSATSLRPS